MCTIAVDDELQGVAVLQIMVEDIVKFTMYTDQAIIILHGLWESCIVYSSLKLLRYSCSYRSIIII